MSAAKPTELQAAVKKTLSSAAFAKFLGQAMHAAMTEVGEQSSVVTFPKRAKPSKIEFNNIGDFVTYECRNLDYTHAFSLQCEAFSTDIKNRHIWYGYEERTDEQGESWATRTRRYVQDDFGNLVKVLS